MMNANGMVAHAIRYSRAVRAIPRILLNVGVIVVSITLTCQYIYDVYAGFKFYDVE